MSMHKSLLAGDSLKKHRNVLNRKERLEKLEASGKWSSDESIYGLPKVVNRPMIKKKKKKKEEEA